MDLKEAFNLLQEEMGAHGLIDLGVDRENGFCQEAFRSL